MLTVAADGSMLSPMIIFKGIHHLKLIIPEGVLVCACADHGLDE